MYVRDVTGIIAGARESESDVLKENRLKICLINQTGLMRSQLEPPE